jgi:hypothetical protein
MISKEMNPTKTQSPMPNQRALWLAAVIPFLALLAQAQSVVNVAPFGSVQDAIDAAMPGDTLLMSAGTFEPTGTIVLNKDGLVLKGAGADATTIDISGFDAWGIHLSADHLLLEGFRVVGDANNNQQYAIHSDPGTASLTVRSVSISGNDRTGLDLNGVDGGLIEDVSSTGAASGYGIALSSCANITLQDITTSGNAWGNVGIYPSATQFQGAIEAPSGIVFMDDLSLEGGFITVQPGALASGGTWEPVISTTDETDALYAANADVRVPEAMSYVTQAVRVDGLDNRAVGAPEDILALMPSIASLEAAPGVPLFGPQTFTDLETGVSLVYELGCTDDAACNYSETATVDDGSCQTPADLYGGDQYDCDGNIPGCMDPDALNYNAEANISAECIYLPAGCIPMFDPAIDDTTRVSCVDLLPHPDSIPQLTAYDPCNPDNVIPVLSSLEDYDLETACGQFVTYRHLALNIEVGVINVQYQTFMVDDTTGPVITSMPVDLVLDCALAGDSANWGAIEAVDACHDLMGISYMMDSMYVDTVNFPICDGNWLIARSVAAMDLCGNATEASYVITVRDLVPPTLANVPASDSLSCLDALPTDNDVPLHSDLCSGSSMNLTEFMVEGDCPENFTLTRTFVATDGCGNFASAEQIVTVEDTLQPTILTTPPNLMVDCGDMVLDSTITAMDQCSAYTLSIMDSTVLGDCPQEYTILRTHSATDACGNVASYVQTIEYVDNEAPIFTDLIPFATAGCADVNTPLAAAFDSCGTTEVTYSAYAAEGGQIRLYTATDACGNSVQGLQMVDFGADPECAGCTDPLAMNYDAAATLDDGGCNYNGLYDQSGECVEDADQDGVCDLLEIVGCTDVEACNYLPSATDAGPCDYPANTNRDCNGECIADSDDDGVCDADEVEGCLDGDACNFSAVATENNQALCSYGCYGCTYESAMNYDATATRDDGLCAFAPTVDPSCEGDANGDGQVGIEDLLEVLANFAEVCE